MKKSQLNLLLVISLLSFRAVGAQKLWTLDDCINYAVEHSIEVQQRINQQHRADNTLQDSKNAWKPTVDAQASQDITLNRVQSGYDFLTYDRTNSTVELNASMPLYTFGRMKNQEKSDAFSLKAITEDLRNSKKQVEINVVTSYLQVLYNRTEVSVVKEKLEASTSALKRARVLYEEGKSPKSDVVQAESTVSTDEYNLLKAEKEVKLSLIKLAQLLNLYEVEDFDVTDLDESDVKLPIIDWTGIVESYPSVVAAKYRIESADSKIKLAKNDYLPTLTLTGTAGNQFSQLFNHPTPDLWAQLKSRYDFVVNLNLKYTLFNGGATKRKVNSAMIDMTDARIELENSKQQIHHDIQNAYYTALIAKDKQKSAEKAERLVKESLGYVEESYQAGRATIFDLIQSQQKWLENREEAVRSKFEYLLRNKILEIYQQ